MAGLIWLWQKPKTDPLPSGGGPIGYSSMGRKRRELEERLARLRKDDEMVLAFVRQFMETLHAPR